MSDKDNHPAQGDTARPLYPVLFDGQDGTNTNFTDFRAMITPVEREDDPAPKASSAPAPVSTPESPKQTVAKVPAKSVPAPAAKANGQGKPQSPGTPAF